MRQHRANWIEQPSCSWSKCITGQRQAGHSCMQAAASITSTSSMVDVKYSHAADPRKHQVLTCRRCM